MLCPPTGRPARAPGGAVGVCWRNYRAILWRCWRVGAPSMAMWSSVRRGEEKYIFPYQEEADVMFNSALIYELSVIKQYAEPLLFSVPKDCDEYYEAKRLLKFLDYFLGMEVTNIPMNSILREFVGGGCFDV
jgi:uridine kinase